MTTMTTLSSEAFLPSGAFDSDMTLALSTSDPWGSTSPIPSPSSLPKSRSHYNRLQQTSLPLKDSDTTPLSLASLRAANASQPNYIPAHLHFETTSNLRAASLSPGRTPRASDRHSPSTTKRALSNVPPGVAAASLSRSVSADAATPSHTSLHIVQRLAQQNALIRDAWEAERNYLEANRRRAEEVYQEERSIMEDVREGWEHEKDGMMHEIQTLKERIQRLEGENSTLKAVTAQTIQVNGLVSPLASQRGGSASTDNSASSFPLSRVTSRSQNPPIPHSLSLADLPPGLDGASRRPHMLSPGSSRVSPTGQPDKPHFHPMDPRIEPQNPNPKDFLASPSEDSETPVPVIDVQEIDPKLEGIPIKATAVQRPTFGLGGSPPSDTSHKSSPATSPTRESHQTDHFRPRGSSREHTLQALNAAESRRLTMHAGHTPNHSLSLFPTVNATETSTIVGQSEGATPTAETVAIASAYSRDAQDSEGSKNKGKGVDNNPYPQFEDASKQGIIVDPEPIFEPEHDRPLKGPLMIRNMPAQDEIFWNAVNKKLEPISQGQNALPTVMQASLDELRSPAGPSAAMAAHAQRPAQVAPLGGDGSLEAEGDADEEDAESESGNKKSVERDVPLKFKSTTNFGAPFGVM